MQKSSEPKPEDVVIEIDFDVISEDWTRYKLKDGTTIRIRTPLMKVFESKGKGPLGYPNIGIVQAPVVISAFNASQTGPPSNIIPKPEEYSEEVAIIERHEKEQEYRTQDGFTIILKPILVKAFKAPKVFNPFGEPVYQVQTQAILDVRKAR